MTSPAIATMTLAGPWGPFHVVATGSGIAAAAHGGSFEALVAGAARGRREDWTAGGPIDDGDAAAALDAARPVVEAALAGRPVDLTTVPLDLGGRSPFDRRVLLAVREVGWGETASYSEIGRRIGAPRAARAVGGAVGRNPISLLVPCHRIIASDGTLGGYGGIGPGDRHAALEHKRALLLREGRAVPERGV